jgi:predicted transcriptional regulator
MKGLTKAEEQIMQIIWEKDKCLVRDIIEALGDPDIPHSTVSSVVRILEKKGFVGHKAYGKTHEYFPLISKMAFTKKSLKNWIGNYFDGSPGQLVSFLVTEDQIDLKELSELMKKLDSAKKPKTKKN